MAIIKNVISTKQRIVRFITGTPAMVRNTEDIYRKVLAFYLDVIHKSAAGRPAPFRGRDESGGFLSRSLVFQQTI